MSYKSIDEIQNYLSDNYFSRTNDARKASGRALGTIVEIITYYWLKENNFLQNLSIETHLSEYGNKNLTHNVEFTLHKILSNTNNISLDPKENISVGKIIKSNNLSEFKNKKSGRLLTFDNKTIIKNGLCIDEKENSFILSYVNTENFTYRITELDNTAIAMFECKRVGKEGNSKGPQTIEKAKQGAYVAKTVSSLQKVISSNGEIKGIYFDKNNNYHIESYDSLIEKHINKIINIKDFILTIGIVSNHGNWFTNDNKNKELEVLCNSYDWLLFLSDNGLAEFINDIFSIGECLDAFKYSYTKESNSIKKNPNIFTKSNIDYYADKKLTEYFHNNIEKINKWFNVLNKNNKSINDLVSELKKLSE